MMTATFHVDAWCAQDAMHTYHSALAEIEAGRDVRTTQMCMLNHVKDYDRIRIIRADDAIDIFNNHDGTYSCDRTSRQLRVGSDFFHLWENGEFDV